MREINYSKILTFDFECTSREPAIPYICSFCRLDKLEYKYVKSITTMSGIIEYIFSFKNRTVFYAHNLKYDISFILAYLFQKHSGEFLVTEKIIMPLTKSVFSITILFNGKTIQFKDTLALFTAPLKKVLKSYTDLEKTETPIFDYISDVSITPEVLKYSKIDALGLAIALKKRLEWGRNALTTASGAFKEFKNIIETEFGVNNFKIIFPTIPVETEIKMRKAYRGGFTFLNKEYQGVIVENVNIIDVNSMYPSQMYNKLMPYGEPVVIDTGGVIPDAMYPLGIQIFSVKSAILRDGFIPFLSNTNSFMATNVYREIICEDEDEDERTFSLTIEEFKLFKKSYKYSGLKLSGGWLFKGRHDLFKKYIDKFWKMKSDPDPTIKSLGKLFLNALYGKFAEGYEKIILDIEYEDKLVFKQSGVEIKEVGYLPIGIFITSYSRMFLIKSILKIGYDNFIYCDTDSIHYINLNDISFLELDPVELGKWGVKGMYNRAHYIRAKRYCGEIVCEDGDIKLEIACAGIKNNSVKEQITRLEDFKPGKIIKTIEFKQGINGQSVKDKFIKI